MDFEPRYTAEQEAFRTEVQEWLRDNIPAGIEHPADSSDLTYEQYQLRRDLGRRLGEKGWLWPTAPEEYGGGGLTVDHSVVLEEEIDGYNLSLPPYYDSGGRLGGNSILVWGSEEQKQEFLPKIFKGRNPHLAAAHRTGGWLRPRQRQGIGPARRRRLRHQRPESLCRQRPWLRLHVDHHLHRPGGRPPPQPQLVHGALRPARHQRVSHGFAVLRRRVRRRFRRQEHRLFRQRARAGRKEPHRWRKRRLESGHHPLGTGARHRWQNRPQLDC